MTIQCYTTRKEYIVMQMDNALKTVVGHSVYDEEWQARHIVRFLKRNPKNKSYSFYVQSIEVRDYDEELLG